MSVYLILVSFDVSCNRGTNGNPSQLTDPMTETDPGEILERIHAVSPFYSRV